MSRKACADGSFKWVTSLGFVQTGQEEEEADPVDLPWLRISVRTCLPSKETAFGVVLGFGFLCQCQVFGNIGKENYTRSSNLLAKAWGQDNKA